MDFRKLFRIRIGCVEKCVKYEKISVLYVLYSWRIKTKKNRKNKKNKEQSPLI